jgi:hypothetical protein
MSEDKNSTRPIRICGEKHLVRALFLSCIDRWPARAAGGGGQEMSEDHYWRTGFVTDNVSRRPEDGETRKLDDNDEVT